MKIGTLTLHMQLLPWRALTQIRAVFLGSGWFSGVICPSCMQTPAVYKGVAHFLCRKMNPVLSAREGWKSVGKRTASPLTCGTSQGHPANWGTPHHFINWEHSINNNLLQIRRENDISGAVEMGKMDSSLEKWKRPLGRAHKDGLILVHVASWTQAS